MDENERPQPGYPGAVVLKISLARADGGFLDAERFECPAVDWDVERQAARKAMFKDAQRYLQRLASEYEGAFDAEPTGGDRDRERGEETRGPIADPPAQE